MPRPAIPPGERGEIKPRQTGKVWVCRVRFRDHDGNRHQFDVGPYAKKGDVVEAAEKRWATEKRLMGEAANIVHITTMDRVAERWLEWLATDTRTKGGSIRSYTKTWWSTLSPAIGSQEVNAVTRSELVEVLRSLFRRRPRRRLRDSAGRPVTMLIDGVETAIWEADLASFGSGHVSSTPKART